MKNINIYIGDNIEDNIWENIKYGIGVDIYNTLVVIKYNIEYSISVEIEENIDRTKIIPETKLFIEAQIKSQK